MTVIVSHATHDHVVGPGGRLGPAHNYHPCTTCEGLRTLANIDGGGLIPVGPFVGEVVGLFPDIVPVRVGQAIRCVDCLPRMVRLDLPPIRETRVTVPFAFDED